MLGMDIFSSDAFNVVEMTDALEQVPYRPTLLQQLGIFEPRPIRTLSAAVEHKDGALSLVQTTPRGAPLPRRDVDKRSVRDFRTVRVALADTLRSDEIQGIRAFGTMTELQQLQEEVMAREIRVRDDVLLTHENMRLGAIQGVVTDADGSTIIDWYSEWGISQAAEIDFDLDNATPASGAVRKKCNQVVRQMKKAAQGGWIDGQTRVVGLCGDDFFDELVAHEEVVATFRQQEGVRLREDDSTFGAFGMVRYGGVTFINYQGTDDGSTVAVGAQKCRFIPVGGRQVFQHAMSPGESFDFANTPGREFYPLLVPDMDRNQYVDIEVYSYPLFICTRPAMLQRARMT